MSIQSILSAVNGTSEKTVVDAEKEILGRPTGMKFGRAVRNFNNRSRN